MQHDAICNHGASPRRGIPADEVGKPATSFFDDHLDRREVPNVAPCAPGRLVTVTI